MASSLPVRAGYGPPLGYFALRGALVLVERALARRGLAVDRRVRARRDLPLAGIG